LEQPVGEKEKLHGTVITNKSGVEKNKRNSLQRSEWFFLVNFRTVATKEKFEEIWKTRFNSVNLRKKMLNKWKISTKFTNQIFFLKFKKKEKRKNTDK
jgi:hypothetical protein